MVLLLTLAIWLQGLVCYAETANNGSIYKSTNDVEKAIEMQVDDSLKITNLPTSTNFNYLMIHINDGNSSEFLDEAYSRQQLLSGTPVYTFSNLANGKYYIELYTSEVQYGTYQSYIYGKDLSIVVQNGTATFSMPMVYGKNQKVYQSNRADAFALSYYKKASEDIQSDAPEITKLAAQITNGLGSDYAKAKAIHDWVCTNIWYDWDAYRGGRSYGDTSALGTLKSKKSVCQGYASITAALLRAANIPAKLVSGYALGVSTNGEWDDQSASNTEGNHAWNEAFIEGRWVIIDSTWDSNNKYENGHFSKDTGLYSHRYFDATLESFSIDHKILQNEDSIPNWWHEGSKTFYINDKGIKTKGWKTIEGNRYYFGENGVMVKGTTLTIAGKKYSFDAYGILKTKR